jgi:hypothetical protein
MTWLRIKPLAFSISYGATASLLALGCGEPDKPPAEAAFSLAQLSPQMPAPGELACSGGGTNMIPSQAGAPDPLLLLSSVTGESAIETMARVVHGKNGETARCTVREGDMGTFSVSAEVSSVAKAPAPAGRLIIEGSVAATPGTPTGNNTVRWGSNADNKASQLCNFRVDARDDGSPFVEPGLVKLSFNCVSFANEDRQTCDASGTIYLENCN